MKRWSTEQIFYVWKIILYSLQDHIKLSAKIELLNTSEKKGQLLSFKTDI
jgi:hypothetical protein